MKKLLLTISLMLMTSGAMAVLTSPDPELVSDNGMGLIRTLQFNAIHFPYDARTIRPHPKRPCDVGNLCMHISEVGQPGKDIQIGWGHRLVPDDFSPRGMLAEMGIRRDRFFSPSGASLPPGKREGLVLEEANALLKRDVLVRVDYRSHPLFGRIIDVRSRTRVRDVLGSLETHEKDAIASLIFDVGLERFSTSRLLTGLIEKDRGFTLEGFAEFADPSDESLYGKMMIQRRFVELGVFTGRTLPNIPKGVPLILPSAHYKINHGRGLLKEHYRPDCANTINNLFTALNKEHYYVSTASSLVDDYYKKIIGRLPTSRPIEIVRR